MELGFKGRLVVVTGGTGALGSVVVGRLLELGASCAIPAMNEEEISRFEHKGSKAVTLAAGVDLTDEASVEKFYGGLGTVWASLHIAGGFAMAPVLKTSREDFAHMMRMNALTSFLCSREAVKKMKAAGGGQGGRIVNVCARPGLIPELGAGMVAYTASKAAVAAMTRAMGAELAGEGILVNAVAPSIMDTRANRRSMPDADYSKWPKLEEVAATILFLASPDNTVTRGAVVPVYGKA